MITESSLKSQKEALDKEKTAWAKAEAARKQAQVDADRLLAKTQAEIDVLEPRAAQLRSDVLNLKAKYDQLVTLKTKQENDVRELHASLDAQRTILDGIIERQKSAVVAANAQKAVIDADLVKYEANNRAIINEQLDVLNQTYQETSRELLKAQQNLVAIQEATEKAKADKISAEAMLYAASETTMNETTRLENELSTLRNKNFEASEHNKSLLATQAKILAENARLEKENKDFKAYESKALKILNNTDEALQERERVVSQREQYRPASHSFLPPRED